MKHTENFNGLIFDVGSGESCSLNHIKSIISQYHDVKWVFAPERDGDVKHTKSNIEPLKEIGWTPTVKIDDGISSCFKDLTKNQYIL